MEMHEVWWANNFLLWKQCVIHYNIGLKFILIYFLLVKQQQCAGSSAVSRTREARQKMCIFFFLLFTLCSDQYSSKYYPWESEVGFFLINVFSFSRFFLVKTLPVKNIGASLANINTFQFKIKSLCCKGVISRIIHLLLANRFHFLSYTILQPRNLTMYSYVHQKGESILKAEVQTQKEI